MSSGQDAVAGTGPEMPGSLGRVVPAGIARQITAEGGRVTFARFMDLALTHPIDGYYSRAKALVGPRGDFSTAPRLSPEFNETLGRLLEELVSAAVTGGSLAAAARPGGSLAAKVAFVELGGGEGELARAVLRKWQRERPDLREYVVYVIVEVGDRLRARQRRALAPLIETGWRVVWASSLEEGLTGVRVTAGVGAAVAVGNEFLDALPVHLVDVRGAQPVEAWVEVGPAGASVPDASGGAGVGGRLRESWGPVSAEAEAELRTLFGTMETATLRPLSRDGFLEIRPSLGAVLGALAADSGPRCLLTIDYGDWFGAGGGATYGVDPGLGSAGGGREGHAGLYGRTVRGYFRHQVETDPYVRVGRQDLTADVDFRALDIHGRQAGFETVLCTMVADMLRGDSAEEKLHKLRKRAITSLESDRRATVLEKLLDDEGLGRAFRVMLQVRE